jgi:alanine-glyoxylate transaminase/serine-glyoxylate transaminase/serine-pyruvate transaminase
MRSFKMQEQFLELDPPERILMGPGPSNVHPRVLKAMSLPVIGHLDPFFIDTMHEVMDLLKSVFQTGNDFTLPISGTGSAGMEAALCNSIEPGDDVVICVNGFFSDRMADIAERCGGKTIIVEGEWGHAIDIDKVESALKKTKAKVVAVVHAETSTGVMNPVKEISELAHKQGALLLVDTVTSLGGMPLNVDEWGIDICYSGTQKCLGCPPGMAPITFSERGMEAVRNRKNKVQSLYLDLNLLDTYWGEKRAYHHTAPISMVYAVREALRLVLEEGLEARFKRHQLNHNALVAGLEAMGLAILPGKDERLWTLNAVVIPEGIDDAKVRTRLLEEYDIEVGGGLGVLQGKVWRVGLMGYTSNRSNVLLFLSALEAILCSEGLNVERGAASQAVSAVYG